MWDEVLVDPQRRRGLLSLCPMPGCRTMTMGGTCVAHDPLVKKVFARGRPFVAVSGDAVPPS